MAKKNYGMRHNPADGSKYTGWKGIHTNSKGKHVTEHSIDFDINGKRISMPSIVPSTTQAEINLILNGEEITPEMERKAMEWYLLRSSQGKSPFKNPEDDISMMTNPNIIGTRK